MEKDRDKQNKRDEKISELDNIFEELLGDAREFAKDLTAGIYLYFITGLLSVFFGLQTGWYNRYYIMRGDIIPLLLAGAIILSGIFIVLRGFGLKKKYARIFELQKELKNF
jgi:hypothetical protein